MPDNILVFALAKRVVNVIGIGLRERDLKRLLVRFTKVYDRGILLEHVFKSIGCYQRLDEFIKVIVDLLPRPVDADDGHLFMNRDQFTVFKLRLNRLTLFVFILDLDAPCLRIILEIQFCLGIVDLKDVFQPGFPSLDRQDTAAVYDCSHLTPAVHIEEGIG